MRDRGRRAEQSHLQLVKEKRCEREASPTKCNHSKFGR
jgi:hypothetical protein